MASAPEDKPTEVINLLAWHRGLHMITGGMALKFNTAEPGGSNDVGRYAEGDRGRRSGGVLLRKFCES